jgi:hypothetical protein
VIVKNVTQTLKKGFAVKKLMFSEINGVCLQGPVIGVHMCFEG